MTWVDVLLLEVVEDVGVVTYQVGERFEESNLIQRVVSTRAEVDASKTYHWDFAIGGVRTNEAIPDGDFAQVDRGIGQR